MSSPSEIRRLAREVRRRFVPDHRVDVFEVRIRRTDGAVVARTTVPGAAEVFRERMEALEAGVPLTIQVLPDRSLSPRSDALVRSAVAPLYRRATMNAAQVSQYVLGNRVTLLYRHGPFWRVRGEDGHVGWIHRGYLLRAEPERTLAWERAEGGEPVVSLGAELQDPAGNTFARLPWGARVIRLSRERILLPDGREGTLGGGEVVGADRLADRFPPLGESITRTARRWLGAPYLWGGVTPAGVDCSGLIQSVFWIHGVAMPRDSDLQVRIGVEVDPGDDFSQLLPGDLLFFAGKGPVDHVALSLRGPHIIHSSASNGGVDLNDLSGDLPVERMLRRGFVRARRVLADRPRVDRPATDRPPTDSPSA